MADRSDPRAPNQRALLREAIAMGIDVVGGCPHLETDPPPPTTDYSTLAAEAGLPIDLHTDETLNPSMLALEDLAERVVATGFPHHVAASHCVSLGMQSEIRQREVAEKVAAAGISVVALPHTNLFLQGRDCQVAMPRAVTAVEGAAQLLASTSPLAPTTCRTRSIRWVAATRSRLLG